MNIAYLVVTHANPLLLARVIQALSSEDADFFVHVDAKSDIRQFSDIKSPKVTFLENRIKVYWAEFSLVRAILALIAAALRTPRVYDCFILLSGSDYPLQSSEYIHSFIEDRRGVEFIDMVRIPSVPAARPISLVNHFCVESSMPLRRIAAKALTRAGILRRDYRRHLGELKPFGGHTWWALSRSACQYVCEFARTRSEVSKFFSNLAVPDETFIHTILGNSPFAHRARNNLLYEDWSIGGAHPTMISERHVEEFEATKEVIVNGAYGSGEVLFARKFSDENLHLIDRIDRMIAGRRAPFGNH